MFKAFTTVVQRQRQAWTALAQPRKVIDQCGTNGAVQTAFALAAVIHIPQAQTARQQPLAAACVILTRRLRVYQ